MMHNTRKSAGLEQYIIDLFLRLLLVLGVRAMLLYCYAQAQTFSLEHTLL